MKNAKPTSPFNSYQKGVIPLLAVVQFTIVLDFMVMAPLGDLLMKTLDLNATQFASAVSVYAFSAGIAGLLAAGFADKYDRKKLLLFFYSGFIGGTVLCGTATSYEWLLLGRIITGLFAGVLGSVSMAIITDLFSFEQRGRVMGFVQMAFAVSQVAGIPIGLYLANMSDWHAPFLMIVVLSILTALVILKWMRPVTKHLEVKLNVNPLAHLQNTVTKKTYLLPFLTTALLSIGGFMLMPFSTPFIINNIGISQLQLPIIYVITGIGSIIILPLIGKVSDKAGKFPTFIGGTILAMIMVVIFTNLSPIPLWSLIGINTLMFAGIMSRMIPSSALMTAIPRLEDRGAFMSINSSLQQIAGGIASVLAGLIIVQERNGKLDHFDTLGYVVIFIMILCAVLMYFISEQVARKLRVASPKEDTVSHEVIV
ncbi:MAG TPA: MFS transporter [Flavitalea sp.]|nr:MFS transporter [Flavitalea sp.]